MGENLQQLHERGEKISRIQDDSEELASDAGRFAEAAKAMRRKQEEKAKKGLFGGLF